MNMPRTLRTLAIALIIALIASLGGWYWYLRVQGASVEHVSDARGYGSSIPTFSGTGGSTFQNILSGLGLASNSTPAAQNASDERELSAFGSSLSETGGSTFENIVSGLGFSSETAAPEETKPPRLWRVLATPGAGSGFVAGATSTTLRIVERSTGYLFETDVRSGKTKRITNTLIPVIYRAHFSGEGSFVTETLSETGNMSVSSFTLAATSSPDSLRRLSETSLGDGILRVAASAKGRQLLTLVPEGSGSAFIRSEWNGTKPLKVFSSRLKEWRMYWLSDDTLILSQPAASGIPGNAYRVDRNELVPLVRSIPGLTILPRADGALLIGSDSGSLTLSVRASSTGHTAALPIRTVADKCVWARSGRAIAYCAVPQSVSTSQFLDDWYRGLVHTADAWWKIDAAAKSAVLLHTPEGESLDVEYPVIDDAGEYISFMNAYDKSVWVLRIAE